MKEKIMFILIFVNIAILGQGNIQLFESGADTIKKEINPLDAYNIVWNTPSNNSSESMPCGGGDIGLNVWVENGDVLFYMQRSGSLAETNEYLKLGRVRLQLTPNPFDSAYTVFRQELKLRQGYVEIEGQTIDDKGQSVVVIMSVWVDVFRPVIHVEVESNLPIMVSAAYENWRLKDDILLDNIRRDACMDLEGYPGEVISSADIVKHTPEGVLFYHQNPSETMVDILIDQQEVDQFKDQIANDLRNRTFGGLMTGDGFKSDSISQGKYQNITYKGWNLTSINPARKHHLRIVTHIEQSETIQDWEQGLKATIAESALDNKAAKSKTNKWWNDFWDRSWIKINPDQPNPANAAWRIGRNYNLFRYQLGCNAFGEYPTKFNGGNFTFDANLVNNEGKGNSNAGMMSRANNYGPDRRRWGGGIFTAQNQRLVYWPLLKSGDADAILPQFELYRKSLPGAMARVKTHFDHDGAVYSEYNSVPGLAMGYGYGWESGDRSRGQEIPFGDIRADALKQYNEFVEKGVMANKFISYHWESQLEHAYMILEYHRFTGADIKRYVPFIENAVIFFDEHYRKRQMIRSGNELDENGKLVIYPSTSCESYRGATNPTDVIAGLQACLERMLDLEDDVLQLRDTVYYRSFLNAIPPYTYAEVEGDQIIQPAASWKRYQNHECPQFYPLFPFNRFNLMEKDHDHLKLFRDTWKHGTFPKNMVQSWHQDGIFFARMGMTEEARIYNTQKLDDSQRRYPTFWGPGHDWVPDHNWGGSGMIGLQEMLMHTIGDKIILFPAWPYEWDVDFKLHAPDNTTVEAVLKGGKLVKIKITPEERKKDVVIVDRLN